MKPGRAFGNGLGMFGWSRSVFFMAEFYAIRNESTQYMELDLEILDVANSAPEDIDPDSIFNFSIENLPMSTWWKSPDTTFVGSGKRQIKIPDIAKWLDGTLILSPKAHRYLAELLLPLGELLPVHVSGETYYIFNCQVFGVDEESFSQKNEYEQVECIAFSNETTSPVFKSKFEGGFSLFCTDLFKDAVNSFDLKGILFDKNLIEVFE